MDHNEQFELVVGNLQEVIGADDLRIALSRSNAEPFRVYWGTATTGRPHVAYFVPIIKIADMLHAGLKVTVLFADLHGYLDNMKAPWNLLCLRTQYYETVVKGMLASIGVPLDKLRFVRGADFELKKNYSADLYRICAETSIHDARKAGAEVVKQVTNPLVSGLLYPLLQALDEVYLEVDAQFGGVDQRKIFMLAEKYLPHLGYKKRIHLMNPMVPGLTGGKMSASEVDSKIDLLDSAETVKSKLLHAQCLPGKTAADGNGVLAFLKYFVFPIKALSKSDGLTLDGNLFATFEEVEAAFLTGSLSPEVLKAAVCEHLNERLEPIRQSFQQPALALLAAEAYPSADKMTVEAPVQPSSGVLGWMAHMLWSTVGWLPSGLYSLILGTPPTSQAISAASTPDLSFDQTMRADLHAAMASLRATESGLTPLASAKVNTVELVCRELSTSKEDVSQRLDAAGSTFLRCVWSISPKGLPHLGHIVPLRKLARISHLQGVHVIILVDDIATHFEGQTSWELRQPKANLVETIVGATFKSLGGNGAALTVIHGNQFKLEGLYMLDLYRLVSLVPEGDAALAGGLLTAGMDSASLAEPVLEEKPSVRGSLACLLRPCTDLLDTIHLAADIRLSSPTTAELTKSFSSKFLTLLFETGVPAVYASHELMPVLQPTVPRSAGDEVQKEQTILVPMTSLVPSGRVPAAGKPSAQMQANAEDLCLPLVEPPSPGIPLQPLPGLKKRIKRAFCEPNNVTCNPVLDVYRLALLPDLPPSEPLVINRSEKNGGPLVVHTPTVDSHLTCAELEAVRLSALQAVFADGGLHPGDLKPAVEASLVAAFVARLTEYLPPVPMITSLLDAAFPTASKKQTSKQKTAPKSPSQVASSPRQTGSGVLDGSGDVDPNRLDIRIGHIVSVAKHPNADSLFVEEVNFGDELGTRTVVSGLCGLCPMEELENRRGAFVINLKPAKMRGVVSQALLLCTSHVDGEVKVVRPMPLTTSTLGQRIYFRSSSGDEQTGFTPTIPDTQIPPKEKVWEAIAADLTVTDDKTVSWHDWRMVDPEGNPITLGTSVPSGARVA